MDEGGKKGLAVGRKTQRREAHAAVSGYGHTRTNITGLQPDAMHEVPPPSSDYLLACLQKWYILPYMYIEILQKCT